MFKSSAPSHISYFLEKSLLTISESIKGGGGGRKNALSLPSPRAFFSFLFTERLFATISEPGTGYVIQ